MYGIQLQISHSINDQLCVQIYNRFVQFIDVLCHRFKQIKLTDPLCSYTNNSGQKSRLSFIYIIISLIHNFVANTLNDEINLRKIIASVDAHLSSVIFDSDKKKIEIAKDHCESLLSDSLQSLLELCPKILLSDYFQSPRFKHKKLIVSYIIIEIKNKTHNWGNIFKDLITPSENLQYSILLKIFNKLSKNIIQSCLVVTLDILHYECLINDNLGDRFSNKHEFFYWLTLHESFDEQKKLLMYFS
ncbi:hypothetical protein HZS_4167 [Henneguya salminicola]|nr:hypothetical protein HZS_4167 [Henneguya salminicola]